MFERKEMCDTDRYATGTQPRGCNAVWGDHCVGMDQSHNQAVSSGECQCSVPSATAWCRCALTGSGETAKRSPSAENCCPLSDTSTTRYGHPSRGVKRGVTQRSALSAAPSLSAFRRQHRDRERIVD